MSLLADGGVTLQDKVSYEVPENLAGLSVQEIRDMRDGWQLDLNEASKENAEKIKEDSLFKELMLHDLVRLSIADVIPELIIDYSIEGDFKKSLLGYQATFSEDLMLGRQGVESLKDYPSYDFRFAAVYMSMLYAFQEYPDFYDRLKLDMVNEETSIGRYRRVLDESYSHVKQARTELTLVKSSGDLKRAIFELDVELARRSN